MSKLLHELSKLDSEVLRPEVLDYLKVTSGKIIACDPLIFNKNSFEQTIQPGTYPIVAWLNEEDGVIACAELKVSEAKVTEWKMAIKPGQNVSELKEGYIFGYPVDTGLGCFADVEAIDKLEEIENRLQQELGEEFISLYDDLIDDVLAEHDDEWGNCVVCEETGSNIIMFRSGYGDGFYPSYWGFDENGKIVSLVTDFQVLYEE
ncbi:cytoplasmic protein [Bacillus pseudomycoides]|uniref:DUF4241 domain-containing protein n=1 Tax=Bacillus pseudomycoides TaxID=64104 RepID=UPI000BF7E84A|nr:DUF4241 domain-containing protein [Bacillus pseudomycoides]PFW91645.1 cytoplasmic protein [Bacillus pseudomycoides]PFX46379.1 cytoplasmic protein [Bacillus pseudomycoides]